MVAVGVVEDGVVAMFAVLGPRDYLKWWLVDHYGGTTFGLQLDDMILDACSLDSDAFESILRKIEETQIHINQLRLRLDKVVRENAELTSGNSRSAPGEPLASCGPSSILPLANGENFPVGSQATIFQHTSQKKLVMTENVVSGCMKVNPCEMIETTNQLYIGRKCDKIKNENLVCNQTIKEEPDSGEVLGIERNAKNVLTISDPNSPSKMAVSRDQSGGKARSKLATPKNKKKRGRRKARTGRWSRRSSG